MDPMRIRIHNTGTTTRYHVVTISAVALLVELIIVYTLGTNVLDVLFGSGS